MVVTASGAGTIRGMTRAPELNSPSRGGEQGPTDVPNATWFGLVSCLDITGMTLLTACRRLPLELRTTWLRRVSQVQRAFLGWVVVWAVAAVVSLHAHATDPVLYSAVGLLMAPLAIVVAGLWAGIARTAFARLRG